MAPYKLVFPSRQSGNGFRKLTLELVSAPLILNNYHPFIRINKSIISNDFAISLCYDKRFVATFSARFLLKFYQVPLHLDLLIITGGKAGF